MFLIKIMPLIKSDSLSNFDKHTPKDEDHLITSYLNNKYIYETQDFFIMARKSLIKFSLIKNNCNYIGDITLKIYDIFHNDPSNYDMILNDILMQMNSHDIHKKLIS